MPDYIIQALGETGLIDRAVKLVTKRKRLNQMLTELKCGGVYMKIKHSSSVKN